MNCNICAKQFFCNKEKCNPVKWSKTKNYGIPERKVKYGDDKS